MSDLQDDLKKLMSEEEFKRHKDKENAEARLKGEEIFWADDQKIYNNPDRRIFKIDVGNLPEEKAEEYIKKTMEKYKETK